MAGRIERQKGRLRFAEAAFRRAIALEPGLVVPTRNSFTSMESSSAAVRLTPSSVCYHKLTPLTHHDLFTWCFTHFSGWAPDIAGDLEVFITADPLDRYSRLCLATLLVDKPGTEDRVLRTLGAAMHGDAEASVLGSSKSTREMWSKPRPC